MQHINKIQNRADENRGATEQLVSPEPDVTAIPRSSEKDEYAFLACDGIFDVFANDDLAEYIGSRLKICDKYDEISTQIIDTSLNKVQKPLRSDN